MPTKKVGKDGLTDDERAFVKEYLIDCNGTRAYLRFKPTASRKVASVEASKWLARPKVRAAVDNRQKTIAEKAGVTEEAIIRELSYMAFGRIDDFLSVNKDGTATIDLSGMTSEQSAALTGVETETYYDKYQECEVTRVKLRHADKTKVLDMLGKHIGVRGFGTSRMELTGANGGPVQIKDVTKLTMAELEQVVAAGPTEEKPSAD